MTSTAPTNLRARFHGAELRIYETSTDRHVATWTASSDLLRYHPLNGSGAVIVGKFGPAIVNGDSMNVTIQRLITMDNLAELRREVQAFLDTQEAE